MALIDGPPADYEDEAAADKDAGGTPERVEGPVAPTSAANTSSTPAAVTVDNDALMDNGMQRARSSSVEDWEKHELEMEALLASLQTGIIDVDTGDADADADADGGSLVDRTPLPPPTASADKAPPGVIAAPVPHTERHEPPAEPAEAMANQRSHDHTDELAHTHEWVRSASEGEGGGAMSAKEREIEELQRKLRELEERLTAGSSDSPGGSLLLPSLLPPSFTSTPARLPTSSLRPLPASHSPSTPASSSLPSLSTPSLPSAPSPSFTAASQHQASPLPPPSPAASPYYSPPPRRAGAGSSGDTRLAAEVIDGLLADNPATDLDLLVPGEQKPQTPTRVPTSGGGGAVSLPPDRRDLFAASLYLTPAALPSASASSASSAQRRGRTGSALSPSSLSTASSSFVPSSPLSLSASSLSSTSTSSLASSASAAAQRDRRRSPDAAGAEQQRTTTASLSGVGAGQRRQVLFHLHKRGTAADQNYLCAGCSAQFGSCTPPPCTHTHE